MMNLNITKNDLVSHPAYLKVISFQQEFDYKDTKTAPHAEWVLDYAKVQYDECRQQVRYLDEKADALFRYFGLLLGGGVLLGSFAVKGMTTVPTLVASASAVCLLLSGLFALSARYPMDQPYPPGIRKVFTYIKEADDFGAAQTRLAFVYERANTALSIIGRRKGERLRRANTMIVCALAVMVIWVFTLL